MPEPSRCCRPTLVGYWEGGRAASVGRPWEESCPLGADNDLDTQFGQGDGHLVLQVHLEVQHFPNAGRFACKCHTRKFEGLCHVCVLQVQKGAQEVGPWVLRRIIQRFVGSGTVSTYPMLLDLNFKHPVKTTVFGSPNTLFRSEITARIGRPGREFRTQCLHYRTNTASDAAAFRPRLMR